jgi:hypothetical protein
MNRNAVAYHEAGHAVAAIRLGGRVYWITISDHSGRVNFDLDQNRPVAMFAGPLAQRRAVPQSEWEAGRRDFMRIALRLRWLLALPLAFGKLMILSMSWSLGRRPNKVIPRHTERKLQCVRY